MDSTQKVLNTNSVQYTVLVPMELATIRKNFPASTAQLGRLCARQLLTAQRREWLSPRRNGAGLPGEHGIRVGPREGVSKFQGELLSNHPLLSSLPFSNCLGHSAPRVQRNSNIFQAHKSPRTEFALARKSYNFEAPVVWLHRSRLTMNTACLCRGG